MSFYEGRPVVNHILLWPVLRSIIGMAVGLDEYRARCQIGPSALFSGVDDDVMESDLDEVQARIATAFGGQLAVPRPQFDEPIANWLARLSDSLDMAGIAEEEAAVVLVTYFESKGGVFLIGAK
jgi:hypothetical protein